MALHLSADEFKKVYELAESVAARNGCELYDVELASGGQILRVFIDKPSVNQAIVPAEAEGADPGTGVGINECTHVSNALNLLLDVENLGGGSGYDLEVSSPGLERALREKRHFQGAVGKMIRLTRATTTDAAVSKETFEGTLMSLTDEASLVIERSTTGAMVVVPWNEIEKARTVFRFEKKPLPGKGPKKSKTNIEPRKMES